MNVPETRYALSGDLHIAYQVAGQKSPDLIEPNWLSHLEGDWEQPLKARFLRELASFGRVIRFNLPGTGVSDPVPLDALPSLDEWMHHVQHVMDVVESKAGVLLGMGPGGHVAALFAAAHPERTSALVLVDAFARYLQSPNYPWGVPQELEGNLVDAFVQSWVSGATVAMVTGTLDDDQQKQEAARNRITASPGTVRAMFRMILENDVRHVLPAIRVPTLVIHTAQNPFANVEHGRYLADQIAGAKYVELKGEILTFFAAGDVVAATIKGFLDELPSSRSHGGDSRLATVLFAEVVSVSDAEPGTKRWDSRVTAHAATIRRQIERFRGREMSLTADRIVALFDGPGRAVGCAITIRDAARRRGLEMRAGLHSGVCNVRNKGAGGKAFDVGARIMDLAAPGEVVTSSTVKDLIAGSGIAFKEKETNGDGAVGMLFEVSYPRHTGAKLRRPTSGWASLTPTELAITELVTRGLANPAIGERLSISRSTVKTHLLHIFAKLGIKSRSELAAQYARLGSST